ncbi:MAG: serine--tRNA ligase [Firmicutes bacterium]|nr:serine--tRNA ligase [Bacillota bacterium]
MLDAKKIRANPEQIEAALRNRNLPGALDKFLALDEQRRSLLGKVEEIKQFRNQASHEVGRLKKQGQEPLELMEKVRQVGQEIKNIDEQISLVESGIEKIMLNIPNIPHESVPIGADESSNIEMRRWGEPTRFEFPPQAHWDIGPNLDILDFERAAKLSGARFTVYKGAGARLERALINFFLDIHTDRHGYQEIFPPFMVSAECMMGTGQLPKFADDMFKIEGREMYMVPTAEVPLTNLYREEILEEGDLPRYMAAYSACFRAEAGSHGRDTRGIIRQHQFNKVELVKIVRPESSYAELEKLTADAEEVLQLLGLPYRVVLLSSGDMGFSAAKTYDLEVWMPSYDDYKEISSCSNCEEFQARRANIRFRPGTKEKIRYVHTLNGSGVAVGRTVAAILENYQQEDGSVLIPEALKSYMGGLEKIERL